MWHVYQQIQPNVTGEKFSTNDNLMSAENPALSPNDNLMSGEKLLGFEDTQRRIDEHTASPTALS
jgi:hypothetical protein